MANMFAPKFATMAAVVALAVPAAAWAQSGSQMQSTDPDRSAEMLNQQVLQEIESGQAGTVTRTTTVTAQGETMTGEGDPANLRQSGATLDERLDDPSIRQRPEWHDQVEIYEDDAGGRYVRLDEQGRVTGAPEGSPLYQADGSRYQQFTDATGNRYIRVDENYAPTATAAGTSTRLTDERLDDPTVRTMPQFENPGQNEIVDPQAID